MDSEIIYAKTASGEEAMHQRTRVMQRNVRMVLILVDGQSTVADLSVKTGNQKLTENALQELEKGGFVEPLVEQDSLWAEGKKVAQEIRAAAIDKALQFSSPRSAEASRGAEPSMSETPISLLSASSNSQSSASSLPRFSLSSPQSIPFERGAGDQTQSLFSQQGMKNTTENQSMASDKSRPSFSERFKAFLPGMKQRGDDTIAIKPIRRGQRSSIGWPLIVMFGLLGVLGAAFLVATFFPYERYLPEVEGAFAQASGRPVKVGSMRVDVYPKAGLFLGDVRIGNGNSGIRIAEIRLQPAISTLMASKIYFREATLSGVTLPAELISEFSGVVVALARPDSRIGVVHIGFEKTEMAFAGFVLPEMLGEAKMSSAGHFESLVLHSTDRSLSLEAKPVAQKLDVSLEGIGWRPSQGSRFLFDSINLNGSLESGAFTISGMEFQLFDGLIQGTAVLLGGDKQPSISGKLSFERVNAARFGEALGLGSQFAGETSGKINFSASAASWESIFSALNADGEFSIRRGNIRGIDLAEAVRRVSATPVEGGATLFEQLSGKIKLTPTAYEFPGLILSSGLMQSTGHIEVSKDLKISGRMELQMRGTVNQTRVPISIGGPLRNPTLQVGKG